MHFALTIDVETDWGSRLPPSRENCRGINKGLGYLESYLKLKNIKATFFVAAEVVPLFRKELLRLKRAGHELALHSFKHVDYQLLTEEETKKDIKDGMEMFSKELHHTPVGFRAPLLRTTECLFDLLQSFGFKYDSSRSTAAFSSRYGYKDDSKKSILPFGLP